MPTPPHRCSRLAKIYCARLFFGRLVDGHVFLVFLLALPLADSRQNMLPKIEEVTMKTILFLLVAGSSFSTFANEIGSVDTAWNLIKNHKIVVERFDDPKVDNVSCYISRAKTGGIAGATGLSEDPARMDIACRAIGPVKIQKEINQTSSGELVFTSKASVVFKSINVTRFYDKEKDALVYLIWSTKLVSGSPFNSVTAVPLNP
jgi:CreA protein